MFDGWKSFLLNSCLWLVKSGKPWIDLKTIFSICWKKFHALLGALSGGNSSRWFTQKTPDEFLSVTPWLRNDTWLYIFLKLNLESLTIYYDLQLCEGFCCIERVLTEICTLSANVMTTNAMWMFSVSAFQLIAMHSFIVVVFLSSPWWNLSSEFQTRVPGAQHEDSESWDPGIRQVGNHLLKSKMTPLEDPAAWDMVNTWPI